MASRPLLNSSQKIKNTLLLYHTLHKKSILEQIKKAVEELTSNC